VLISKELVLTFGGCYLCATFGENRSRNATVRVRTVRNTHRDKLNLSHAICYSYVADNYVTVTLSILHTGVHRMTVTVISSYHIYASCFSAMIGGKL